MNLPIYNGFTRSVTRIAILAPLLAAIMVDSRPIQTGVEIERSDNGWRVSIDGEIFTEFHTGPDLQKPFFYPIMAPGGGRCDARVADRGRGSKARPAITRTTSPSGSRMAM